MLRRLSLFLGVVFVLAAAPGQPAVPDTPVGHVFSAWQHAFNSGDRETYRAYAVAHRPAALKMLDETMEFREQTGGFDLLEIEKSTPTELVAIIEDRLNETFARMTLGVDPAHPALVQTWDVSMIPRPAELALPPMSDAQLVAALRPRIDSLVADDRFSGAVLVAHNGATVFEQAYGLADREHKIPNTLDTKFRIGSMNKMITAVGVMQLVQAGKVSLSDPLGKYLPDYPNKDVAAVTIEQLLTHTGGTGDIFGPEWEKHRNDWHTLADIVKTFGARGVAFKPGSKFDYSNYGFILLGRVIESASGQSYYDYVHDHVYLPAGMTSTGSEPEAEAVPNRSIGYTQGPNGALAPNTDSLGYRASSAGGGYSTVGDLLRFANALQNNTLLDAEHVKLLTTGKVDAYGSKYAYGFVDQIVAGTHCYGHNGGAPGQNGELLVCPQLGYVVTSLANMDPMAASRIQNFIVGRIGPAR